jgi:branched-chain amino acid transport system substrate-binding protein
VKHSILAAALSLGFTGALHAQSTEPVKIGIAVPLTGPAAVYAAGFKRGADLAADEINAKGGILGGRKIQVVYEDDKGTPAGGVAAVQKLMVQDKVSAIGGGSGSSVVLAETAITKNRILHMNSGAQADSLTEQDSPFLFTVQTVITSNSRSFNRFLIEKIKPKTVAFIGDNGEFSKKVLEVLTKDINTAGIKLVESSLYDAEIRDFTSILTRIKAVDPDVLYVSDAYPARSAQLWKQVRQLGGFRTEVQSPGVLTPAALKAAGGSMEGVYSGDTYAPQLPEGTLGKKFVEDIRRLYNIEPGKEELVTYETIHVLADAMNKAGSDRDYPKLANILRTATFTTPRGSFTFDKMGRAAWPVFYVQRVKGDQLTVVDTLRR